MSYRVHGICFVYPAEEAWAYRMSSPFLPRNNAIRIVLAVVHASPIVSYESELGEMTQLT